MGDMYDRAHGLHIFFWRLLFFRLAGRVLAEGSSAIEAAEEDWSGVDAVETIIGLDDSDRLTDERLTEEDAAAKPFDLAVAAYPSHFMIGRIVGLTQPAGIGAGRRLIVVCRCFEAKCLVRALLVEDPPELVETTLLSALIGCRRIGCLLLQRPVHSLMTAVLLRLTRLDPLRLHTGLDQLHREPAETAGGRRRKGRTVVGADHLRQADLAECRLQHRPDVLAIGLIDCLQPQNIATGEIAHSERIAAPTVLGQEPTFEVDTPDLVRQLCQGQRQKLRRTIAAPSSPPHQTMPIKHLGNRAARRPLLLSTVPLKPPLELLGTPCRMLCLQHKDRQLALFIDGIGMMMRRSAPVLEPRRTFRPVAINVFVAGLPAHSVTPTEVSHTQLPRQPFTDKLHSFVHLIGLFPSHRRLPRDGSKCYPCPRSSMSPICPVHTVGSPLPIGRGGVRRTLLDQCSGARCMHAMARVDWACFGWRPQRRQGSAFILAFVAQHPERVEDVALGIAQQSPHGEESRLAVALADGVVDGAVSGV